MNNKLKLALGIICFVVTLYLMFYSFWSFNTIGEVGNSAIVSTILGAIGSLLLFIIGIKLVLSFFKK